MVMLACLTGVTAYHAILVVHQRQSWAGSCAIDCNFILVWLTLRVPEVMVLTMPAGAFPLASDKTWLSLRPAQHGFSVRGTPEGGKMGIDKQGITTALVIFEREQHSFRQATIILKRSDGEVFFHGKALGFNAIMLKGLEPTGVKDKLAGTDGHRWSQRREDLRV